ncbi:MAG: IPT/TIG domain-containing protein [Deltaproteobacteria bacterium]|nr:IPT/TIG domain-containing protein [Deltaproteobacteria bacterium]
MGPATGHNWVTITGTNFQVQTGTVTVPLVAWPVRVSVTFGGIACSIIRVESSTRIRVKVPTYTGAYREASHPPVAVVVTNLQADGATPVQPLERATLSGAYTYQRWGLRAPRKEPVQLRVLKALIARLERELVVPVSLATSGEYGESGATATILATVPCVVFRRVSWPRDREFGFPDNQDVERSSTLPRQLFWNQVTRMLVLDTILAGGSDVGGITESSYLLDAFLECVEQWPYLVVEGDPDLYPGETNEYELQISEDPTQGNVVGNAKIMAWSLQLRVRGIPVIRDAPDDLVYPAMTPYMILGNIEGDNLLERSVLTS